MDSTESWQRVISLMRKRLDSMDNDIKSIRDKHNLTQLQLSEITGIPKRTIENWEGGQSKPKDYIINLIDAFLKIKLK